MSILSRRSTTGRVHSLTQGENECRNWVGNDVLKAVEKRNILVCLNFGNVLQNSTVTTMSVSFQSIQTLFLKLKQKASGCPGCVQTESDKDTYIEEYRIARGTVPYRDNIAKNPGQRTLAKLRLNSV